MSSWLSNRNFHMCMILEIWQQMEHLGQSALQVGTELPMGWFYLLIGSSTLDCWTYPILAPNNLLEPGLLVVFIPMSKGIQLINNVASKINSKGELSSHQKRLVPICSSNGSFIVLTTKICANYIDIKLLRKLCMQ